MTSGMSSELGMRSSPSLVAAWVSTIFFLLLSYDWVLPCITLLLYHSLSTTLLFGLSACPFMLIGSTCPPPFLCSISFVYTSKCLPHILSILQIEGFSALHSYQQDLYIPCNPKDLRDHVEDVPPLKNSMSLSLFSPSLNMFLYLSTTLLQSFCLHPSHAHIQPTCRPICSWFPHATSSHSRMPAPSKAAMRALIQLTRRRPVPLPSLIRTYVLPIPTHAPHLDTCP